VTRARLAEITLPDFGMPAAMPTIPPALYAARLERLRERAAARGYDRLVVYADREHSANLAWLNHQDNSGINNRSTFEYNPIFFNNTFGSINSKS
jgi:hypothetical protein